jgi:limonene-1,2-epoxide hydrolase
MTRSADEVVTEFCRLWTSPDPEQLAGYFTEEAIYHNIPMDPVQGREAIKEFIAGFTAAFDGIDFQVHRQLSDGNLVLNERTDVMRRKGGGEIPLPMSGVRSRRRQDRSVARLLRHGHDHERLWLVEIHEMVQFTRTSAPVCWFGRDLAQRTRPAAGPRPAAYR